MPTAIICPRCGGTVGMTVAGKRACTCAKTGSSSATAIATADLNDTGARPGEKQKLCCVCGKDVTHSKRMKDAATGKLHLVTSKTGRDGSIAINQDADLWLAKLDADNRVTHKLAPERHAWVHVAEGEVSLNGKKLSGGDAAALSEESALELSATKTAQVLLFDLS